MAAKTTRRPLRKRAFFRSRGRSPFDGRPQSRYFFPTILTPQALGEPVYSATDLRAAVAAALVATLGFHRFKRTG